MKSAYSTCDKGHYVYKYVLNNEVIYVGKTDTSLDSRIAQHGKSGDNIPSSAWKDINSSDVYYVTLNNSTMSDVVESELIRRYKPKYNVAKKSDWSGLPFPEPEWTKYEPQLQREPTKKTQKRKLTREEKYPKAVIEAYEENAFARKAVPYIITSILHCQFRISRFDRSEFLAIKAPEWVNEESRFYAVYKDVNGCSFRSFSSMYKNSEGLFIAVGSDDFRGLKESCGYICDNMRLYSKITGSILDEEYIRKLNSDMEKLSKILETVPRR